MLSLSHTFPCTYSLPPLSCIVMHILCLPQFLFISLTHIHTHRCMHTPRLTALFISISMPVLNGCSLCPLLWFLCLFVCVYVCWLSDGQAPAGLCGLCGRLLVGRGWEKRGVRGELRLRTLFPSVVECLHTCSCLERLLTAPRSWQETTCCLHWGR